MLVTADDSALANVAYSPDVVDHAVSGSSHVCQYISNPLAVQTISAQTVTGGIMAWETTSLNNLFPRLWIGLYSGDGSTLITELFPYTVIGSELSTTANTGISISITTSSYTMLDADAGARLVIEFSASGTPAAGAGVNGHNLTMRFGNDGAGGDVGGAASATKNPYIQFTDTFVFLTHPGYYGYGGYTQ